VGVVPALQDPAITEAYFSLKGMPTDELSKKAFEPDKVVLEMPVSDKTSDVDTILNEEHQLIMVGDKTVQQGIKSMNDRVKSEVLNEGTPWRAPGGARRSCPPCEGVTRDDHGPCNDAAGADRAERTAGAPPSSAVAQHPHRVELHPAELPGLRPVHPGPGARRVRAGLHGLGLLQHPRVGGPGQLRAAVGRRELPCRAPQHHLLRGRPHPADDD